MPWQHCTATSIAAPPVHGSTVVASRVPGHGSTAPPRRQQHLWAMAATPPSTSRRAVRRHLDGGGRLRECSLWLTATDRRAPCRSRPHPPELPRRTRCAGTFRLYGLDDVRVEGADPATRSAAWREEAAQQGRPGAAGRKRWEGAAPLRREGAARRREGAARRGEGSSAAAATAQRGGGDAFQEDEDSAGTLARVVCRFLSFFPPRKRTHGER